VRDEAVAEDRVGRAERRGGAAKQAGVAVIPENERALAGGFFSSGGAQVRGHSGMPVLGSVNGGVTCRGRTRSRNQLGAVRLVPVGHARPDGMEGEQAEHDQHRPAQALDQKTRR